MELHEALAQITEIRVQMARTEVFRGYRAVPVLWSGLLALGAAGLQAAWIPDPAHELVRYLVLWVSVAVLSVLAAAAGMVLRSRHLASPLKRELTWLAVEQFLPCVVAGGLVAYVLVRCAPESAWLLPGLWQILFSLGVFASYRLLPRATFWVAVYYLLAGVVSLAVARNEWSLAPWAMGLPFGVGQLLAGAVLYWTLERNHGTA